MKARNKYKFCKANYLNYNALSTVEQVRRQYLGTLIEIGMITDSVTLETLTSSVYNKNGQNLDILICCIAKGCSSSILKLPTQNIQKNMKLSEIPLVSKSLNLYIHPSCVISDSSAINSKFFIYFDAGKTSRIYARDITVITSYFILILFAAPRLKVYNDKDKTYLTIDEWLGLEVSSSLATSLLEIRRRIEDIFISKILNDHENNGNNDKIISLVEKLCKIKISI